MEVENVILCAIFETLGLGGYIMIDPLISLAFSVYSNKGVYALLLGSGISRAAGIPTGWDVVVDLIQKVAALEGQDTSADPEGWYTQRFGETPDYSKLLDALAKSPPERQQLLRGYFEPTEKEREQGLKTPTSAHKAIAELVSRGYIKVIITTNFDRLLERALEEVGVIPIVISTTDAIKGAPPIQHNACTIIKVHGDYLDTRIKNTPAELGQYEAELNQLLDRVYDEYGLIISGWSGDWDVALRAAIERCVSRRFTTYWSSRSEPSNKAKQLITHRRGEIIIIPSADAFFTQLNEKVLALEDIAQPHPLSSKMAIATLKRYLVDERHRIALHDLLMRETQQVLSEISQERFPLGTPEPKNEELAKRVTLYEAHTSPLIALMITGCYWGNSDQASLWTKLLTQIANPVDNRGGFVYQIWDKLQHYPALLLAYAGGIAAVINKQYHNLAAILLNTKVSRWHGEAEGPLVSLIQPHLVIEKETARSLPGHERQYVPTSERLFQVLRVPFKDILPKDEDYEKAFDYFEAFFTLVVADIENKQDGSKWAPYGRFGYKLRRDTREDKNPIYIIQKEAEAIGEKWEPLHAGFFDRSADRFKKVQEFLPEIIARWNRDMF